MIKTTNFIPSCEICKRFKENEETIDAFLYCSKLLHYG